MNRNITLLIGIVLALLVLAGCKDSGGSNATSSIAGSTFAGGSGSGDSSAPVSSSTHTPEPTTIALMGAGLATLSFLGMRKKK